MIAQNPRPLETRPGDAVTLLLGGCVYLGVLVAVFWT